MKQRTAAFALLATLATGDSTDKVARTSSGRALGVYSRELPESLEAQAPAALAGLLDPSADHEPLPLEAMQRRIERRRVEDDQPIRLGLDGAGNVIAVAGLRLERTEDEHLGAALAHFRR